MIRRSMLAYAQQRMARGDYASAVEPLRTELGDDPENARAHALLAVCLLNTRRRVAAEHEARLALSIEPELPDGHAALAWVLLARRDVRGAELEAHAALAELPDAPALLRLSAAIAAERGDRRAAREGLERALAIEPGDMHTRIALGDLLREQGAFDEATVHLDAALAEEPENGEALAARGALLLARGDGDGALELALASLRVNAALPRALRLLAGAKARRSVVLGLWWRWNAWMISLRPPARVASLVGAYGAFRASALAAYQLHAPRVGDVVSVIWCLFALYTWAAIPLYRRMLARELDAVRLRPGF